MSLEERIERLERTNRRYRRILALLVAVAICAMGISATQEPRDYGAIRAKTFQVVDDEGHVIIQLGVKDGDGHIVIYDTNGVGLLVLSSTMSDGVRAGIIRTKRGGKTGVSMTSGADGNGSVSLFNSDQKKVVNVTSTKTGDGGAVMVYDQSGEVAIAILSQAQGGTFIIYNQKREPICTISAYPNGGGLLHITDQNGQVQIVDY